MPDLHEGQVIEIEGEAQSQARLSARQKTLFVCEFGKLGQNYTVRIRHPFDAGQDFMDGLAAGLMQQARTHEDLEKTDEAKHALTRERRSDQLTRAMEELRGVLHEEDKRPEAPATPA